MRTRHTSSNRNRARILIVGIGGLGSPAAMALARSGIGTIGLVDPDVVDVSNLPRQLLYQKPDVGRPKVDVAAERLRMIAPGLHVVTTQAAFTSHDTGWFDGFDAVLDGTDSIAVKFALSDAAVAVGVPLVHAGAVDFRAQLLTIVPHASACYRCVFEEAPPADDVPSCQEAGIVGPVVALAGSLQAVEAIRLVTGERPLFADRLLSIDLRTGAWRSVAVTRRVHCAACGDSREPQPGTSGTGGRAGGLRPSARRPSEAGAAGRTGAISKGRAGGLRPSARRPSEAGAAGRTGAKSKGSTP